MNSLGRALTIGNVTLDRIKYKDGKRRSAYGGTLYSSLAALRMDYESNLLARCGEEVIDCVKDLMEEGVIFQGTIGKGTTIFLNDYSSGKRKQRLLRRTGRIYFPRKGEEGYLGDFDLILLNPMYHEMHPKIGPAVAEAAETVCLDPQGILRTCKHPNNEIELKYFNGFFYYLDDIDILKMGSEEARAISKYKKWQDLCEELHSIGPDIVAITFGKDGSLVFDGRSSEFFDIPAYETIEVDPTGAGDVYGMSFTIKYHECGDAEMAGLFASAAASFVVEDYGPESIAPREKVEERYEILKEKML